MGNIYSSLTEKTTIPPLENPKKDEPCSLLINGVCDAWTQTHFIQFLRRSGIPFSKVNKTQGQDFAILFFKNNKDRQFAYNFLSECQLSNPFQIRPFHGYDPPQVPYATQTEILKYSSMNTQPIFNRLFPLAHKPLSERLKFKLDCASRCLNPVLPTDYPLKIVPPLEFSKNTKFEEADKSFDYSFQNSDEETKYHKTIELIVGYDADGEIAVGFNTCSRSFITIAPIDVSFGFPDEVVNLANDFAMFVKRSPFPPYDMNSLTGKWRNLLIRVSSRKEIMVVVVTNGGLPLKEVQTLEKLFKDRVQSLYWAKSDQSYYDETTPNRVLLGTPTITEQIGDYKFIIHPFAPFPYNLTMISNIMEKIVSMAGLDNSTILVDVGCGVGVQCIYLSSKVKRTVGFDTNEHLINSSMQNKDQNDIKNAFFIKGTAASGLSYVANNITNDEKIVCLLNSSDPAPPVSNIKAIAECEKVKKFVYISDSQCNFCYDAERLLLEGNELGTNPFKLVEVELFDVQPKSQLSTLVALFVRE
ncbi:hypothetical protein M9Y10_011493 [Tritrichomonas musculus]|uniref:Methyltransferase domain-containing protein n=1 Tax=Tritrichomonas musculus TaxID=1915356 RepID=A0ABR2IKW2_9EUKA